MEAFSYAAKKTAAFYDSQKRLATEHAVFDDVGRGEPVREAGNGQGQLMSSLTVLRLGASLAGEQRSGQARAAREEGGTGAEDRHAEISEGRDGSRRLQEAVDRRAAGTGEGAAGAGQMRRAAHRRSRCCAAAASARAAAPADCWAQRKHGHRAEAQACFEGLTRSSDAYARAEGFWGLEQWEQANEQFRLATQPKTASRCTRSAGACCCTSASTMARRRTCFARRSAKIHRMPKPTWAWPPSPPKASAARPRSMR